MENSIQIRLGLPPKRPAELGDAQIAARFLMDSVEVHDPKPAEKATAAALEPGDQTPTGKFRAERSSPQRSFPEELISVMGRGFDPAIHVLSLLSSQDVDGPAKGRPGTRQHSTIAGPRRRSARPPMNKRLLLPT